MNNALTVSGLTKTYKDFVLDNVSFSVPSGSIVGLIGENGAGKSTTINAALGLIHKEAGHVSVLGKDELDNETKEQIGVVFDGSNYPEILSPKKINQIMKNIYGSWDEQAYFRLLKQFSLPLDKQIKQFSKGMKMKLAISVALSHHSKLLILDEATSGPCYPGRYSGYAFGFCAGRRTLHTGIFPHYQRFRKNCRLHCFYP